MVTKRSRPFDSRGEVSLLYAVNVVLRYRHAVVGIPVTVAILVVVGSVLLPPTFTASAGFTPQSSDRQQTRFSSLATEFGIDVPMGGEAQSPQFYADLFLSRELLRKTVLSEYRESTGEPADPSDGARRNLVDIFKVQGETKAKEVSRAIEFLRQRVRASTDNETGVVELSVTTSSPLLSKQIAQRMIELLHEFNIETRTSQASAERRFVEDQLSRADSALRAAEDSLEAFLQNNRSYENSPELRFEYQRLQRRVTLRQQLYTSLSQSYQQASIDEVRTTPVITMIDPVRLPATPDSRRLFFKGVLSLVLGGIAGILWAFGRDMFATNRQEAPDDYAEFERLREEARQEARSLWQRLTKPIR